MNRSDPHTVVIIDDHDIVRFGLEMVLSSCSRLRVVGSAASLREGLGEIARLQPDLVITDMGVGDSQGLETVRQVVAAQLPRQVLVVSMHDELLYGEQVLALGAGGYLMKEGAHAEIVPAALGVLDTGTWVSPRLAGKLARKVMRRMAVSPGVGAPDNGLSMRELEILEMLKTGKTTKEIAANLELSTRTVDIHRANIKRKLGLRTGAELIAFASSRL